MNHATIGVVGEFWCAVQPQRPHGSVYIDRRWRPNASSPWSICTSTSRFLWVLASMSVFKEACHPPRQNTKNPICWVASNSLWYPNMAMANHPSMIFPYFNPLMSRGHSSHVWGHPRRCFLSAFQLMIHQLIGNSCLKYKSVINI